MVSDAPRTEETGEAVRGRPGGTPRDGGEEKVVATRRFPVWSIVALMVACSGWLMDPVQMGVTGLVFAHVGRRRHEGTIATVAWWVGWVATLVPIVIYVVMWTRFVVALFTGH